MLKSMKDEPMLKTVGGWSRRLALGAIGAAALTTVAFAPAPAAALEVGDARKLVEEVSAEILALANDPGENGAKRAAFEKILRDRSDVRRIARLTLGPNWRGMTPGQKDAYTSAFIDYISNRFVKSFNDFRGGELTIQKADKVDGPREERVLVKSLGKRAAGDAPIAIDWVIVPNNGEAAILDLKVEAVSLVVNQRAEIGAILNGVGGDYDKLIAKLKESVEKSS